MDRFGMYAKVVAKPGQRDALVEHLLEAARLLTPLPGCGLYIVNVAPDEPDAIWVTEVWRSEADHDDSLKLESVKALIPKVKPLVESTSQIRLVPMGGKGMPAV
ncbi:MAG: antibiotic biosynthesis monooxygenase [Acidobacteriia bacterium]|nr:antibiotic biosynthesis monooxygenase [Terriglobia bacterium]